MVVDAAGDGERGAQLVGRRDHAGLRVESRRRLQLLRVYTQLGRELFEIGLMWVGARIHSSSFRDLGAVRLVESCCAGVNLRTSAPCARFPQSSSRTSPRPVAVGG